MRYTLRVDNYNGTSSSFAFDYIEDALGCAAEIMQGIHFPKDGDAITLLATDGVILRVKGMNDLWQRA